MSRGELERIERRLIEVERLLRQLIVLQGRLIELLLPPTSYPRSSGGTITVK